MPDRNFLQRYAKSETDRYMAGVCGGLGEVTPVPSWAWRVLFVAMSCLGGFGGMLYVAMWLLAPSRPAGVSSPGDVRASPRRL